MKARKRIDKCEDISSARNQPRIFETRWRITQIGRKYNSNQGEGAQLVKVTTLFREYGWK